MFCQLCFKKGQQFATINNQHRKMLQKIDGPIIPTTLSQKYICPSCEKNLITCFQTLLAVEWKQVMLLNNEQSEEMLCRIKNRSRELSSIPVMTTFNKPSYFTIIPNSKQTENIRLESNAAETAKQIELKTETDMDNIGAASAHGSIGGNNVYKMECKSELPKTVFGQSECKTEADTELVKVEDPANMENDFSEIIKFYWDNQLSQKSNAVKDSPAENQQTVYNLITEETANDLTNESWSFNSDEIIDVEQYVGDDDKDNNQQSALVCRKSYPVDDEDVTEIETFEITDYGNESGKSFPMKTIKANTKSVAEVESSFSSHTTKKIDYGIAAGKSLIKKSYKSKTDGSKILDYGNEISKSLLKKSNQTITKVTAANEKTDGSITFKFENYGNIKAVTGVETTVGSKTHEINNYGNEAEKSFPKKISKSNIKVVSGPVAYKTHINFDYGNEAEKSFPKKISKSNIKVVSGPVAYKTHGNFDNGNEAEKSFPMKISKSNIKVVSIPIGSKTHINFDYGNEPEKSFPMKISKPNIKVVPALEKTVGYKTREIFDYGNESEKSFPMKISKPKIKVVPALEKTVGYKNHGIFDYGNEAEKSFPMKINKPKIKVVPPLEKTVGYKNHGILDKSFSRKINMKVVSGSVGSKTQGNFDDGNESDKSFPATTISKSNIKVVPVPEKTVGSKTHVINNYFSNAENNFSNKSNNTNTIVRAESTEKTNPFEIINFDKEAANNLSKTDTAVNKFLDKPSIALKTQSKSLNLETSDKLIETSSKTPQNFLAAFIAAQKNVNNDKVVNEVTHRVLVYKSSTAQSKKKCKPIKKSNNFDSDSDSSEGWWSRYYSNMSFPKTRKSSKKNSASTVNKKQTTCVSTSNQSINCIRTKPQRLYPAAKKTNMLRLPPSHSASKRRKFVEEPVIKSYQAAYLQSMVPTDFIEKQIPVSSSDDFCGFGVEDDDPISIPAASIVPQKSKQIFTYKKSFRSQGNFYFCKLCSKSQKFTNVISMRYHIKFYHFAVGLECLECGKLCRSHTLLLKHFTAKHNSNEKLKFKTILIKKHKTLQKIHKTGIFRKKMDRNTNAKNETPEQKLKQIKTLRKGLAKNKKKFEKIIKTKTANNRIEQIVSKNAEMIKSKITKPSMEIIEGFEMTRLPTTQSGKIYKTEISKERLVLALNKAMNLYKIVEGSQENPIEAKKHRQSLCRILPQAKELKSSRENVVIEIPKQIMTSAENSMENVSKAKSPKLETFVNADFTNVVGNPMSLQSKNPADTLEAENIRKSQRFDYVNSTENASTTKSPKVKTIVSVDRTSLPFKKPADTLEAENIRKSKRFNPEENASETKSTNLKIFVNTDVNPKFLQSKNPADEQEAENILKSERFSYANSIEIVSATKSTILETSLNSDFINDIDNQISLSPKKSADQQKVENLSESKKSTKLETSVNTDFTNSIDNQTSAEEQDSENMRRSKRFCYANSTENASPSNSTKFETFVNAEFTNSIDSSRFLQSKKPADELNAKNIRKSKRFNYANSTENVSVPKSTALETSLNADTINGIDRGPCMSLQSEKLAEEQESENMRRSKRFSYANSIENARASNSTKLETFVNAEFTNSIDNSRSLQSKKPADELNAENIRKSKRFNYANSTENVSVPKSTALEASLNADTINGIDNRSSSLPKKSADQQKVENVSKSKKSTKLETSVNTDFTDFVDNRKSLQSQKPAEQQDSENMGRSKRFIYANSTENARPSNSTKLETFVNAEFTNSIDNLRSLQSKKLADEPNAENIRKSKRLNYANSTENVSATKSTTLETSLNADFINDIDNQSSLLPQNSADQQKVKKVSKSKKSTKLETSVNTDFTDSVDNQKSLQSKKSADQENVENVSKSKKSKKLETSVNTDFTNSIDNQKSSQSKKPSEEQDSENMRRSKRFRYASSTENASPSNSTKLETFVNAEFTNFVDNSKSLQSKKPADELNSVNIRKSKRFNYANSTKNVSVTKSTTLETFSNADFINGIDNRSSLLSKKSADQENVEKSLQSEMPADEQNAENHSTSNSTKLETFVNADLSYTADNRQSKNPSDTQEAKNISKSKKLRYANSSKNASTSKSPEMETFVKSNFNASERHNSASSTENVNKSKSSNVKNATTDHNRPVQSTITSDAHHAENIRRSKRFNFENNIQKVNENNYICSRCGPEKSLNYIFYNDILQHIRLHHQPNEIVNKKNSADPEADEFKSFTTQSKAEELKSLNTEFEADESKSLMNKQSDDNAFQDINPESDEEIQIPCENDSIIGEYITEPQPSGIECQDDKSNPTENATPPSPIVTTPPQFATAPPPIANFIKKLGPRHYICTHCSESKSYACKLNVRQHIKYCHYGYRYMCTKCTKSFTNTKILRRHYGEQHKCEPFTGPFKFERPAKYQFTASPKISKFSNTFTKVGNKNYNCCLCPAETSSKYASELSVRQHIKFKHFGYRYFCSECNWNFQMPKSLQKHYREKHSIENGLIKLRKSNSGIIQPNPKEISIYDNTYKKLNHRDYICLICTDSKSYRSATSARQHVKLCHYGFSYACTECCRTYSLPKFLLRHYRLEHKMENVPKMKFEIPGNGPAILKSRKISKFANTFKKLDKNFICKICKKSREYASEMSVRQHVKYCHFDYRYSCSECAKKFTLSVHLRKHYKLEHNIENGLIQFLPPKSSDEQCVEEVAQQADLSS